MKSLPALVVVAVTTMVSAGCSVHERWPYTAEASLGVSYGMTDSDAYRDDRAAGGMAEALLARRFHAPDRGGWIGAFSATAWGIAAREADCLSAPSGGCVPHFPAWGSLAALAGLETANTNARVLVGPALAYGDDSERPSNAVPGAMLRLDGAIPFASRLSLTASFSSLYVPDYFDDSFINWAFGVGVRIR